MIHFYNYQVKNISMKLSGRWQIPLKTFEMAMGVWFEVKIISSPPGEACYDL